MVALTKFSMTDLSRQKRMDVRLGEDLTADHLVHQAAEHFLERQRIPPSNLRWGVYSRGLRLDPKQRLGDALREDDQLRVIPEVSAGAC